MVHAQLDDVRDNLLMTLQNTQNKQTRVADEKFEARRGVRQLTTCIFEGFLLQTSEDVGRSERGQINVLS
jgi:hypothetical protein